LELPGTTQHLLTFSDSRSKDTHAQKKLFIWDYFNDTTGVFDSSGNRLATIPYGGNLATDSEGNLYIAHSNGPTEFRIYAPPYTTSPTSVQLPKGLKINFVTVDQKTGVVAALTQSSRIGGGDSEALFYRHGETDPCATVPYQKHVVYSFSGAFDAQGILFVASTTPNNDAVVASISGECAATTVEVNTYPPQFKPYGFTAVDANNNIVVQNYTNSGLGPLLVFKHPSGGSFGQPISTITFKPFQNQYPAAGALTDDGYIWLLFYSNVNPSSGAQAVDQYSYPTGGNPVQSITSITEPNGIAVYPAVIP